MQQPVWTPKHQVPSGYAEGLGAGRPGRPSSNQIRTTIRARLYGTSVAPSDNSKGGRKHRAKGFPPGETPQPPKATRELTNTGSNAGPSAPAYSARPKPRRVVRSQVAG
jgi:hypothetical protein